MDSASAMENVVVNRRPGKGSQRAPLSIAVAALAAAAAAPAAELAPVRLPDGRLELTFPTTTQRLYSVQETSQFAPGFSWTSIAHAVGTGELLRQPVTPDAGARYFRLREVPFRALSLDPSAPVTPEGQVRLPDAVLGMAYRATITPALSGVPPYVVTLEGAPPAGFFVRVLHSPGEAAAVQVDSLGSLLTPVSGQFSVTVVDATQERRTTTYTVQAVDLPLRVEPQNLVFKAGEPVDVTLSASGAHGALQWTLVDGVLPAGVTWSPEGRLSGTPTASAAELNEDGRYALTVTAAEPAAGSQGRREATGEIRLLVRLSYALNIRATRDQGPSLRNRCVACHGAGFLPDLDAPSATALIGVLSGSGAECDTDRAYIVPGDASDSLVYEKVLVRPPCGDRMPLGGPYLSPVEIARLARWIRELGPEDRD